MAQKTALEAVLGAGRRQFPTLIILRFFSNLLLLVSSIYMLQVFDRVMSSGSVDTLIWLTVIALVALVVYGVLEAARRNVLARSGEWIEAELSPHVMQRSIRLKLARGQTVASLNDVADLKQFAAGDAILAFLDAPWSPIFIAIIWLMNPLLGVVAVIGAILLFAIGVLNDVLTRKRSAEQSRALRDARADSNRLTANAETLTGLGMVGAVIKRWQDRHATASGQGRWAGDMTALLYNVSRVLRLGLQIAILGAGAWLVLQGDLTTGGMIAASIILSRALSPVERAISAWKSYGMYRAARHRLVKLFTLVAEPVERITLPRPKGRLVVSSLRFMAPLSGEALVKDVSFTLEPGETCGLLGPSGCGKTTLCKLLVGAWRPTFGEIRLDGAEVAEWDSEELGRYLGYLPQTVELFSGTVAENIARLGEVDQVAVLRAAQSAGAHEMILALPNGYETDVGDFADRISGGQRQRIGLARALYGDPALVVLDEPNSNLDGSGEMALLQALRVIRDRGATAIVVSHLPHLLRISDKVLVMQDGKVARFGPRDEVLREMMQQGGRKAASAAAVPDPAKAAE